MKPIIHPSLTATLRGVQAKAAEGGNLPGVPDNIAALFYDIVEDIQDLLASPAITGETK